MLRKQRAQCDICLYHTICANSLEIIHCLTNIHINEIFELTKSNLHKRSINLHTHITKRSKNR